MNLYLRLLVIWLRTAFRPRQHPFIPTVTHFRVRPWEIDVFGHMNNGRYLQIMDLARVDWMRRCGVATRSSFSSDLIRDCTCRAFEAL